MQQVVCYLTSEIINHLPVRLTPNRYKHLWQKREAVKKDEDVKHLVKILMQFPEDLDVTHIKTLEKHKNLYENLPEDEENLARIPAQMFLFIASIYDPDYIIYLKSAMSIESYASQQLKNLVSGIQQGILKTEDRAKRVIDKILSVLLARELEDRFYVVKYFIDAPFYAPYAVEVIIIAAAHFSLDFCNQFKQKIKNYVPESRFDKIQNLVRKDVNLFCQALRRLPPRFESSERFEKDLWGADKPIHPDAGLWMLAFCSLYPVDVFKCMKWVVLPSERARLTQMSNPPLNWTVKISELIDLFILCK